MAVSPGSSMETARLIKTKPSDRSLPHAPTIRLHTRKMGESHDLRCPAKPDVTLRRRAPSVVGELAKKTGVRVSKLPKRSRRTVTRGQVDYIFLHSSRSWFQGCQKWLLICERVYGHSLMRTPGNSLTGPGDRNWAVNHLLLARHTPFPHLDPHCGGLWWTVVTPVILVLALVFKNKNLFSAFLLWNNSSLHCISVNT